jgi:hypothetical protein
LPRQRFVKTGSRNIEQLLEAFPCRMKKMAEKPRAGDLVLLVTVGGSEHNEISHLVSIA